MAEMLKKAAVPMKSIPEAPKHAMSYTSTSARHSFLLLKAQGFLSFFLKSFFL
jgi:hypothetical protein